MVSYFCAVSFRSFCDGVFANVVLEDGAKSIYVDSNGRIANRPSFELDPVTILRDKNCSHIMYMLVHIQQYCTPYISQRTP